jgi:hypothetical protein
LFRAQTSRYLVAEEFQHLGPRPDESDTCVGAAARKRRVLAQEAVAGMDGVATGVLGCGDYLFNIEIWRDAGAAQCSSLIRFARMKRLGVVFRKDGHRANAELGGRPHYPDGDFAAICD